MFCKKSTVLVVFIFFIYALGVIFGPDSAFDAVNAARAADIVFCTDFDSGGGVSVDSKKDNHFDLILEDEQGYSPLGYMHFKLTGAKGEEVSFAFINLADSRMPSSHKLLYSKSPLNKIDYVRMEETVGDGFTLKIESDTVFIANYYPYPYEKTIMQVFQHKDNKYVTVEKIGTSHENRPMYAMQISDPDVDDENKEDIVILARQHPGETVGSFHMDGVIDYVLEIFQNSSKALENDYRFHFLPHANPDGIHNGYHRYCSRGYDLNRRWKSDSPVEIVNLKNYLINNVPSAFRGVDLHASTNRNFPSVLHSDGETQAEKALVESISGHIKSLNGIRSSTTSVRSRGFFFNELGGFMVSTEKYLYSQDFDPDYLREQGKSFIKDMINL